MKKAVALLCVAFLLFLTGCESNGKPKEKFNKA